MQKLSFTVEKFGELIPIKDTRFAKVRLWAFASGDNRNNLPTSVASLKKAENSIYGQPILWYYNRLKDDAGGHDLEEVPCGFISTKPEEANISYEPTEDGRLFFCFDALIWKLYSGKFLEIMEKTDGVKKVSVEMLVEDYGMIDNKQSLETFYYTGVTVLGEDIVEAVPDARVELTAFSADKEQYLQLMQEPKEDSQEGEKPVIAPTEDLEDGVFAKDDLGTGESIKKNLSKESAFTGAWGDVDKTKLRNDLLKAKNYNELIKACYLIILDGWEDAPSEKLKYPVCTISNGELVLAVKGCESALSYLEQNTDDPNYSSAKTKLKKYYKILGLSTENFEAERGEKMPSKDELAKTFEVTYNELQDMMRSAVAQAKDEEGFSKFWLCDFDSEYAYIQDTTSYKSYAVKYQKAEEGEGFVVDFENMLLAKEKYVIIEKPEDESEDEDESFVKKIIAEKIAKVQEEMAKDKEACKAEYEAKIEEMNIELNSLKEFKANIEKEEEMAKKERILNSFEAVLSETQIADWREKSHSFESLENFEQSLKAFAFDFGMQNKQSQSDEDNLLSGVNIPIVEDKDPNVFNRLKAKYKI